MTLTLPTLIYHTGVKDVHNGKSWEYHSKLDEKSNKPSKPPKPLNDKSENNPPPPPPPPSAEPLSGLMDM